MAEKFIWMQEFRTSNKRKTRLLLVLFPISLFVILFIVVTLFSTDWYYTIEDKINAWFLQTSWIFFLVLIALVIRGLISFYMQKDIMFNLSGAKELQRKDNPELYNIVENLCISKWLPMPKIAIIDEPWMNAFATWWKPKDSWIAFTSWLIQNLNKREIEAVAWHELTHIISKDSLLMYVAVVFIWCISIAWEFLVRTKSSSSKSWKWATLLWLLLLLLWYVFYPLIKLAISRKREYIADLWSVEITRDWEAMISALRKISGNSYVASSNKKISSFFIANPKDIKSDLKNAGLGKYYSSAEGKKQKTSILDSHPSIDDRIEKIRQYSGL